MSDVERKWLEQARYDLDTARAMLTSGRYLYVLFCCQQAVEKALKALYIHRRGDFPPRLHNLPRLAEAAGLGIEGERLDFMAELSVYYIQSRYPEEVDELAKAATPEKAKSVLVASEEVVEWLVSMMK